MAWTTPRTWTTGEIVTAAYMNTHVRDNLLETAPAKVTTLGDLIIGSGTGAIKRLGRGSAHSVLGVNSSGTDLAWSNPHLNDYSNHIPYAITGGTSTAYTVTLSPAPSSIAEGFGISIKIHITSGASPTLNVNALGAKVLKNHFGNTYGSGELVAGRIYTFRYNGTDFLADSAGGIDLYFGYGSNGALNTTGDVIYTAGGYTGWVYKEFTSVTINAGHTVTADQGCRGLIFYVTGDVTISGTLRMDGKGTYAPGWGGPAPMPVFEKIGAFEYIVKFLMPMTQNELVFGGAGGSGGYGGGYGGSFRASGGSAIDTGRLGYGGHGGGGGGGCAGYNSTGGGAIVGASGGSTQVNHFSHPVDYSFRTSEYINYTGNILPDAPYGCGGMGAFRASSGALAVTLGPTGEGSGSGGGGAGGVGYAAASSFTTPNLGIAGSITGGLIIIIAKGNITINSGGIISANGSNGGAGGDGKSYAGGGGGGGGSGGGVIQLIHKGSYTNNGTVRVNGGSGGSGGLKGSTNFENGYAGSSGTAGTIKTYQV